MKMEGVCNACRMQIFNLEALANLWRTSSRESDDGRCEPSEGERLFFDATRKRVLDGVSSQCSFCILLQDILDRDLEHRGDADDSLQGREDSRDKGAGQRMKLFLGFNEEWRGGPRPVISDDLPERFLERMYITEDWENTRLWPYEVYTTAGMAGEFSSCGRCNPS